MTINEALEAYRILAESTGKRSQTWRSFAKQFAARWGAMKVEEVVRPSVVRAWILDERKAGNSESTINSKLCLLRQLCRLANEEGVNVEFPPKMFLSVNNQRTRFLTEPEERKLAEELAPQDFDIVSFFLRQGLRSQEGFFLKVADCCLETNTMRIRRTKTGHAFTARMHPDVRRLVSRAKKKGWEYLLHSDSVGARRDYERWDYIWKATVFRPALRRAGIKDFKFHDLRHTAATRLVNKNVNIQVIAAILNHADLKSTRRYCHVQQAAIDQALRSL